MAVLYKGYRFRAVDEWSIRVRGALLEIREGTRGARATYEGFDRDQCVNADPAAEMARREDERVRYGYLHYGHGHFPNDRLRRVGRTDPERLLARRRGDAVRRHATARRGAGRWPPAPV